MRKTVDVPLFFIASDSLLVTEVMNRPRDVVVPFAKKFAS